MSATNPTWTNDIQNMFTQAEIKCMNTHGLDLTSYSAVSGAAQTILSYVVGQQDPTQPPSGSNPPMMPPQNTTETPYWTLDMINIFSTWVQNGMPQ